MRELGSVGSVCLRCQFKLLVTSRTHARRAISNSAGAATASAEAPEDQAQSQNEGWPSAAPASPLGLGDGPSTTPTRAPQHTRGPRRPSSIAMFQSIVENQARSPASPGAPAGATASIELVKDVARIQTMMEREGATLGEAYTYFEETVYPQIQKDGAGVPQIMKNQIAGVLLNRLALEKPRDFESNLLPSATRITEVMVDLDVLTTSAWAGLLIHMIQLIYRQDTNPDSYDSIKDFETAMALRDGLLHDLLGAWRVFCAQRSTDKPDSKTKRAFKAPRGNAKAQQPSSLQKAFGAMFPQYPVPSLLRPTFAAFATYKLLTDPFNRSRAIKGEAASFLQMMKEVIFHTRPPRLEDFKPVFDVFPDLPRYVWPQKQSKDKGRAFLDSASVFGEKPDRFRATVHRQLGEAIKSRNLETVRRAWVAFWGEAAVPEAARISELANSPDMFDYFIFAYTMMRRPQQAIEVWNNMERIGVKPTIKTWSSMLHGCVKGNNVRGIRTVWDKLMVSGVRLDTTIWTARIHGLFACGEPDAGLRALNEMATTWAAREDPRYAAMAVQPTVEPVNAAVSGLLRLNRDADATRVLSWASKKGINPDIYTFNTLLRPLVRRGDLDGIDEIFATMRSINISADVATFTVLLEGTLSNIGDLAPEQQVTTVERILEAMKKSGIAINMQMYAKVFYLLLQDGDRTEEPVKAMLSHIWRRGLELTSHIYTMLAEHYFSRDPPDADAVTALIDNRRLHENKGIDRVFWERVMKGYCQAGELARAMDIFDRVFANGTTVTFSTLYDLLRPLVDAGDGAAAMRVVNAARKIGKPDDAGSGASASQDGLGRRQWKHRFWHLAYEEGLMEEPLVERFRGANAGPVDVNA